MSNRIVKGFGGNAGSQEVPRQMAIAKQIGQPVLEYTGPVSANVMFTRMDLAFHGDDEGPVAHRPYLAFQGKIRSIAPVEGAELPGNVGHVLFDEVNSPAIRGRWELSNSEIAELAEKGCFGGNSQVMPPELKPVATDPDNPFYEEKAVRSQLEIPTIFTEVQFEGVPIECVCQSLSVDVNGRDIPVFVATPMGRTGRENDIILTSAAAGYGNMSQYFDAIKYYEYGDPSARKEYVRMDSWLEHDAEQAAEADIVKEMAAKAEQARAAIKGPKVLSPAEGREQAELAALRLSIDDRVRQAKVSGPGGGVDQMLAYENQASEIAERLDAQNAARAAQEGAQAASEPQDGSKYIQLDDADSGASESLSARADTEASGAYQADDPTSDKDDEKRRREAGADTGREQQAELTAEERIRAAQQAAAQVAGAAGQQRDLGDD